MKKKQVLFIGDGVAPTGFSTVMHGILKNIPAKMMDIHHLAINYHGDPHEFNWKIYPAQIGNLDYMGMARLKANFSKWDWDGIFILNDVWVIAQYLRLIKETFEKIPPIVVYFPVDAKDLDKRWFSDFDIVSHIGVYTRFGLEQVLDAYDTSDISIVPHGVDQEVFKKLPVTRLNIRKAIIKKDDAIHDSFIVLSANRNQPRKRLDITLEGFALFQKDKPDVRLYMHCGMKDTGIDVLELATRLGFDSKLIVTNTQPMLQHISRERLNVIYNACDVGINTSTGEGWSLTNMEHAVTGAAQVVPNHSALPEIFSDCGVLVPINQEIRNQDQLTLASLVKPSDVANSLQILYDDRELLSELSQTALEKFNSEIYNWNYITKSNWIPIFEAAYEL